jgi:hypothetical protein
MKKGIMFSEWKKKMYRIDPAPAVERDRMTDFLRPRTLRTKPEPA